MAEDFTAAMRQWKTGICLVTATGGLTGHSIGLVCTTLSFVSFDPPLVCWPVDHRSSSLADWRSVTSYALHILPPTERPLDDPLVARFAQKGGDKFAGLNTLLNAHGDPVLPELPTRLDCVMYQRIPVGDHDLMIGQPTAIIHPEQ
jgi:flavin reductase (DIM6/NTAB) family NADH-FMN oxidoreductase RutF